MRDSDVFVLAMSVTVLVLAGCAPPGISDPPRFPVGVDAADAARERIDAAVEAGVDAGARSDAETDVLPPDGQRMLVTDAAEVDVETDAHAEDAGVEETGGADVFDAAPVPPDGVGARLPHPGDLAIVELLINPAGSDSGREWIEIANRSGEPLDLAGLVLADVAGKAVLRAGVLAPGALLVVGQSTDRAKNGGAPVDLGYGLAVSLNNDGDRLMLCLGPCDQGVLLDRVVWENPGSDFDGHAMIIDVAAGARCPATDSFGTAGSAGTPGAPNPPCP